MYLYMFRTQYPSLYNKNPPSQWGRALDATGARGNPQAFVLLLLSFLNKYNKRAKSSAAIFFFNYWGFIKTAIIVFKYWPLLSKIRTY